MSGVHWLDALTPPLEHHLQRLAMSIKAFLQKAPRGPANNPASTSDSEPLDTRQSDLKEMLSAPMNLRDAIRWTGAASQDDIRLIDGLLFMSMASSYYWNSPEKFMVGLRRCLQNSKVLPEELAHKLLDDAEDAYKSFQYTIPESDTNGRWKQRNEHVDAICAVLGTHLPAKEECAGRILSLPVTTYLPALIAEYLKNEYYKSWLQSAPAKFIFDLITEEDHGKAPLYVLKMIISEVETDQDIHRRAVIAAKRLLGKDFDQWYVGIRGVTLSEDRKQREQAEARKEELRLRHAILEKGGVLPELGEHQTPLPVRPRRTWKFWKK